jgi:acetyl-CoA carboxylase biotin carboxylase subunit
LGWWSTLFKKLLIANRGEIAVRVIRACRDLGIRTVAVYSDADRAALHVRFADEAYGIGPAPASDSYLRANALVMLARKCGAEAIHPGYGFLAESPSFARACAEAGLIFIGPSAEAMALLGEKSAARRLAQDEGLPITPGLTRATSEPAEIAAQARSLKLPVVLKAAAGGGGKGMRIVRSDRELDAAIRGAMGEAQSAFGDASLYVERYLDGARHIEVQFVADARGEVVWLGERDCSIQRRHQKLIEEAPAPALSDELRRRLGEDAVRLARAARYVNAGTAEFLVDAEGRHFFLEVNARLQVEHPVTELVTGLDLVALQLAIAAGEPLPFTQSEVVPRGHAIECRIAAEDPAHDFAPSAGTVTFVREPSGPGVRVDSSLYASMTVPIEYDPLLAKVIAHGRDRPQALARLRRALREMAVAGVRTTLPFHQRVLDEADFVAGRYDTGYVAGHWPPSRVVEVDGAVPAASAALLARRRATPSLDGGPSSAWRRAARQDSLR